MNNAIYVVGRYVDADDNRKTVGYAVKDASGHMKNLRTEEFKQLVRSGVVCNCKIRRVNGEETLSGVGIDLSKLEKLPVNTGTSANTHPQLVQQPIKQDIQVQQPVQQVQQPVQQVQAEQVEPKKTDVFSENEIKYIKEVMWNFSHYLTRRVQNLHRSKLCEVLGVFNSGTLWKGGLPVVDVCLLVKEQEKIYKAVIEKLKDKSVDISVIEPGNVLFKLHIRRGYLGYHEKSDVTASQFGSYLCDKLLYCVGVYGKDAELEVKYVEEPTNATLFRDSFMAASLNVLSKVEGIEELSSILGKSTHIGKSTWKIEEKDQETLANRAMRVTYRTRVMATLHGKQQERLYDNDMWVLYDTKPPFSDANKITFQAFADGQNGDVKLFGKGSIFGSRKNKIAVEYKLCELSVKTYDKQEILNCGLSDEEIAKRGMIEGIQWGRELLFLYLTIRKGLKKKQAEQLVNML